MTYIVSGGALNSTHPFPFVLAPPLIFSQLGHTRVAMNSQSGSWRAESHEVEIGLVHRKSRSSQSVLWPFLVTFREQKTSAFHQLQYTKRHSFVNIQQLCDYIAIFLPASQTFDQPPIPTKNVEDYLFKMTSYSIVQK